jgi:hypothetical protein
MPKDVVHDGRDSRQSVIHRTACRMCRQRKVKCNKSWPCTNCTQTQNTCDFPSPIRTVHRPKKAQNKTSTNKLDNRSVQECLDRLETLLSRAIPMPLPSNEDDTNEATSEQETLSGNDGTHAKARPGRLREEKTFTSRSDERDSSLAGGRRGRQDPSGATAHLDTPGRFSTYTDRHMSEFNDMLESTSNLDYWIGLTDETNVDMPPEPFRSAPELYPIPTMFSETTTGSSTGGAYKHQSLDGFPFRSSNTREPPSLLALSHRRVCWKAFVQNVDPVIKILHKPTIERTMMVSEVDHYKTEPSTNAMIHGVCLLAVVSMAASEVRAAFGCDKNVLVNTFTKVMEQALTAADFLAVPSLVTLQGVVLYLYALKCNEDSRLVALSGTAIRMAEQMRLNVDGVALGYGPLEVELRRRLWWQLVILVDRIDDCSTRPVILSCLSDTKFPLNIDDHELNQLEEKFSQGHGGFTESSFCLMQYEIVRTFHKIILERNLSVTVQDTPRPSLAEAEQQLVNLRQDLTTKYMQQFDYEQPLQTFVADVLSMILAKRRLLIHTSFKSSDQTKARTENQQDRLFLIGVKVLEMSRSIQTDVRVEKWKWLSGTYFQWSVTSLVLKELAIRPRSYITNRAWNVVDGILDDWPQSTRNCRKAVAIKELMAYAIFHRDDQNMWSRSLTAPSQTAGYGYLRSTPDRDMTEDGREKNSLGVSNDNAMATQLLSPTASSTFLATDIASINMMPWN